MDDAKFAAFPAGLTGSLGSGAMAAPPPLLVAQQAPRLVLRHLYLLFVFGDDLGSAALLSVRDRCWNV